MCFPRLLRDMHYYLSSASQSSGTSNVAFVANLTTWHERLGPVHTDTMQNMSRHHVVGGLEISSCNVHVRCLSIIVGKSSRNAPPKCNESRLKRELKIVHLDVCSERLESMGGPKYFFFHLMTSAKTASFIQ